MWYIADPYRAKYSDLPENQQESELEQCTWLTAFSKIACAGSHCLQSSSSSSEPWLDSHCVVCEFTDPTPDVLRYWDNDADNEAWKDVIASLMAITEQPTFQQSHKARVLMAVAIGRIFNHISTGDYLDLEHCSLGQWLLKCLTRSIRELRIAAS
jgi:serine/threonine-protein kinase ATR